MNTVLTIFFWLMAWLFLSLLVGLIVGRFLRWRTR